MSDGDKEQKQGRVAMTGESPVVSQKKSDPLATVPSPRAAALLKSFPLRLPRTTRAQAGELARREGVSLNLFIAQAIAEKITRMECAPPSREALLPK